MNSRGLLPLEPADRPALAAPVCSWACCHCGATALTGTGHTCPSCGGAGLCGAWNQHPDQDRGR